MAEYDAIADGYSESKTLPFRAFVERYTLFGMLGDIRGAKVLDMACGDGFYTRLLKTAGASEVTGIDVSERMIRLAREAERSRPLGCEYVCADAMSFEPPGRVDIVVAAYLLNYARTPEELGRMCRACHRALRPGGRFAGLNDNVLNPPGGPIGWEKYGFARTCARVPPREGDVVLYVFEGTDGNPFEFRNYHHAPTTYETAFREAGFRDFKWVSAKLDPSERANPHWDDFMASSPIIGLSAAR